MNNITKGAAFFAGVLFLTAPAFAQSSAMINRVIDKRFAASDTSKDGRLTKAEAEAGGMVKVVANFDKLDTENLGYVTAAQIKAMVARR